MTCNMILCGVGGQGVLSLAAIIAKASLSSHLNVRQSEVHGMSQRGGEVLAHLRISDGEIYSDLVSYGTADLIISMEPMESLRYLEYLKPDGIVVTAAEPVVNIGNYPDLEAVYAKIAAVSGSLCLKAEALAEEEITPENESLKQAIRDTFAAKGESVVETNLKAFEAGRNHQ